MPWRFTSAACLGVVGCGALNAVANASAEQLHRIPVDAFAGEPRGDYPTGTFEELWVDARRDEPLTSDPSDKRRLMVQIWYPAVGVADAPRAIYALHRELYPHDEKERWLDDAAAVRTTSVLGAPVARAPARFAVLLYNPGAEHPPFSGTFQTEFLASHGYVVVALGHSDITRIERFPDGSAYDPDVGRRFVADLEAAGPFDVQRFRSLVQHHAKTTMRIHVQDISFVLDRLRELDATPGSRFHQRLDLASVGSLGWSFGGALSLQASRDEPRIQAAVNLDGWLYTDVPESGTHRPILQMHGGGIPAQKQGAAAVDRELALVAETMSWQLYARSRADWYDVTLGRAEHPHFSDRPLFESVDINLMHPRLAHDIVNRITLEFFDKYLRRSSHTPLLDGTQAYPDTLLLRAEREVE